MTRSLSDRRDQLRDRYGFDFPEDLFQFWEFANRFRPLEPLAALVEATDIHLVGPFEVLAGRFDGRTPRYHQHLHWRYATNPPEFFTVLGGRPDSLIWGYHLDNPRPKQSTSAEGNPSITSRPGSSTSGLDEKNLAASAARNERRASARYEDEARVDLHEVIPPCVVSYCAPDTPEMCIEGNTLFDAVRRQVETLHSDYEVFLEEDPQNAEVYEGSLKALANLRDGLMRYASGQGWEDHPEMGELYLERYEARTDREALVVAPTEDGMGIVVPAHTYVPLSMDPVELSEHLWSTEDPAPAFEEGRRALQAGHPGTALKLGKDLWTVGGEKHTIYAQELLENAYTALDRDILLRVLRTHRAHPHLPSVDILECND